MSALLEVTELHKAYGGVKALDGCTMSFQAGAINGLIGPNGSGKTTLFNVMTGYQHVDSGQVRVAGQDITAANPETVFRKGIGRTFQITRIFPRLTVIENVHVAAQRQGLVGQLRRWTSSAERDRARAAIDSVNLTHLTLEPAGNLSFGQQKLLEFACIMVARPTMMLLDEPAGGVNPSLLRHLAERIRALNAEGVTFLIVEHDMEFVMGLCHAVAVMHQGKALASGKPAEVRENPAVLEAYLGADMRESD